MPQHRSRRLVSCLLVTFLVGLVAAACKSPRMSHPSLDPSADAGASAEPTGEPADPGEPGADANAMPIPPPEEDADADAPADASATDDAAPDGDAASVPPPDAPMPPFDAGAGGACAAPLGPGDLVIDELMIASVAGSGDHGEWFEVRSTLGCALDLRGVRGNAPSGARVQTFSVSDDLWIPAYGSFVVADSSLAAINHELPGPLVVWSGQPGDVLRNPGATVTVQSGDVLVDTVTYPSMKLIDGVSLAFPPDCAPAMRADWTKWQPSTASWFPGFHGTPNAPNDDVRCP